MKHGARRITDPLLMVVSILVITGFQAYWLKNSYDREAKSLEIKTNMAFQETVREQQAVKLRINNHWKTIDSLPPENVATVNVMRDIRRDKPARIEFRQRDKEDIVDIAKILDQKIKDSIPRDIPLNKTVVLSMKGDAAFFSTDSVHTNIRVRDAEPGDRFFQFLYEVDSLQDSIRVKDLTAAYANRIREENISVPFSIIRKDSVARRGREPVFNEAIVGFIRPVSYRLELGNTFPYLLKRITMPILFSLFLIGVTILSFVLLYRNLLKQRRLAAIKNEFISNITHELKTPIATVGVAIEALKNFSAINDPARTREYLDISSNELQRLSLLVDKVLKLSMFENKEIEVNYESLNLQEIVDEVVNSMRLQFEKYHATVTTHYEGDLVLNADRLHMLSVVFNMLDNALKYGGDSPEVKVTLREQEDAIQLSVADNGIGIDPAYKNRIFEKFFRVPTGGDTHNAKGHGLGLSYVSEVIRQHGGSIHLESQPGKGSTFEINLPKNRT